MAGDVASGGWLMGQAGFFRVVLLLLVRLQIDLKLAEKHET